MNIWQTLTYFCLDCACQTFDLSYWHIKKKLVCMMSEIKWQGTKIVAQLYWVTVMNVFVEFNLWTFSKPIRTLLTYAIPSYPVWYGTEWVCCQKRKKEMAIASFVFVTLSSALFCLCFSTPATEVRVLKWKSRIMPAGGCFGEILGFRMRRHDTSREYKQCWM